MLHYLLGKAHRLDIVDGKGAVLHECNEVVHIAVVVENLTNPPRSLIVGGARGVDENGMEYLKRSRLSVAVIGFSIDEDKKRISEPVHLLPGGPKRRRRLRSPDACNLHVDAEFRKIYALRRTSRVEFVCRADPVPKPVFQIGANCLTIGYAVKIRIPALGFGFGKGSRFISQRDDRQWWLRGTACAHFRILWTRQVLPASG